MLLGNLRWRPPQTTQKAGGEPKAVGNPRLAAVLKTILRRRLRFLEGSPGNRAEEPCGTEHRAFSNSNNRVRQSLIGKQIIAKLKFSKMRVSSGTSGYGTPGKHRSFVYPHRHQGRRRSYLPRSAASAYQVCITGSGAAEPLRDNDGRGFQEGYPAEHEPVEHRKVTMKLRKPII